ncbi:MAG: hypothetical protein KatS3mg105_0566 [Gemmatales bacterium]|nr:MAG: hypothetical protein KatS3mg105_0566 [Gemmatales bacterium]
MNRIVSFVSLLLLAAPVVAADEKELKEDPAASKLLADARAARAQWQDFPGFQADIEINLDGTVVRGKAAVSPAGKVSIDVPDARAEAFAKRTLSTIVDHRLDNSAALKTPCAFTDSDTSHPLGRAIRVLNDEFHSSYRIRDRQIIVVNRRMPMFRFTITVLKNRLNADQRFLTECFVVNSWDLQSDKLLRSQTFYHTWKRVGKLDLPESVLVVTASSGKLEAQKLTLSNFKLGTK